MNPVADTVSKVDTAFIFIFSVSFIILFIITFLMVFFVFKYHKSRHPEPADIEGNVLAETLWTVIPIFIVAAMFYYGWEGYKALREAPENSMNVKVEAKMWSWKFIYPDGKTSRDLYVPAHTPVKLEMTSLDVIHSFYVPAFRIKMDTVPGMETYTWFRSGEPDEYDIQCAEYCGVRHAFMLSKVYVLPEDEYQEWKEEGKEPEKKGPDISVLMDYGCVDCHSMDGSELVGPTFEDIYNRETVVVLEDGTEKTVKADEEYLKRAILQPNAEVVKGYDPMMPSYEGSLNEGDLERMIDVLTGKQEEEKQEPNLVELGRQIAENEGCTGCHSTNGEIYAGPTFKGLMDREVLVEKDGKDMTLTADARYIISSINNPGEHIVKGYDNIMPAYDYLEEKQMKALIEYLSTLK
ncbi:cytochrome c oxidase subunit II [Limisalsivibrio acetivorans]|uniref:cytochrome c oxidase subunit II n=1 Tax=Limisalsivibrio acetivorans TaxID=1304888 RepID=UPI0003B31314|nr:cytochrome c oxidase subunit II [Limisalsivibrio acetivorans]